MPKIEVVESSELTAQAERVMVIVETARQLGNAVGVPPLVILGRMHVAMIDECARVDAALARAKLERDAVRAREIPWWAVPAMVSVAALTAVAAGSLALLAFVTIAIVVALRDKR